jgi:hypothetical protein
VIVLGLETLKIIRKLTLWSTVEGWRGRKSTGHEGMRLDGDDRGTGILME